MGKEARQKLGTLGCLIVLGLAGCAVQLASAYDASIDAQSQSLETDFLTFAALRQTNSTAAPGAYGNYVTTYADFSARIASISLRAAGDPGGVTCGAALNIVASLGRQSTNMPPDVAADAGTAAQSCVTLEVAALQRQFTRLQQQDALRCTVPGAACATLFPPGTVSDFLPASHGTGVLVRAVVVSLDSLVGFEQDLKPATKG